MRPLLVLALAAALAGCASYDGRGLIPGQATAQDVEKLMGPAAERATLAGGETVLFFPRAPEGRHTYAARIGGDGRLIALEQRLAPEYFARIVPKKTTSKEVRELLGPPYRVDRYRLKAVDAWNYRVLIDLKMYDYNVIVSPGGTVEEAFALLDPTYGVGTDRGP